MLCQASRNDPSDLPSPTPGASSAQQRQTGPQMCYEQDWTKVCDYLFSQRERSDAERNAVTHSEHFGDGNDVRNQTELHKALHLQTLTESRAAHAQQCKLTKKQQFRRKWWKGVVLILLLLEGTGQISLHICFVPYLSNMSHMKVWPVENWAYVRPSYNSTSIDGFQTGLVPRIRLLIAAEWNQAMARGVVGLLFWPSSSHQQAQQRHISFCSHCSIPVPPQNMNTAWGMLVRKLAACFHHEWLLRFKYCVCAYLATRDPTKDWTLKHQKGAGWKEGHLPAELATGINVLIIVSHIKPILAAKSSLRQTRGWPCPVPKGLEWFAQCKHCRWCWEQRFLSPAGLLCLLPLGNAKLLMASLPLWIKCHETLWDTGSKSTHHGKRNKPGQSLVAHLIQLLSCIHSQVGSLWWVELSALVST